MFISKQPRTGPARSLAQSTKGTDPLVIRKKVKHLSGIAAVGKPIFRPGARETWVLQRAYHKCKLVVGTVTDAQGIRLTNGTTDIVAPVDLVVIEGQVQKLLVTGNAVIDRDNPLTLVVDDAGSLGSSNQDGALKYDLILFLEKIQ